MNLKYDGLYEPLPKVWSLDETVYTHTGDGHVPCTEPI